MRTIILSLLVFLSVTGFSQKKPLIEKYDAVVKEAKAELGLSCQGPDGELYLLKQEHGLKGSYIFCYTNP